jgi:hypothetical protein
MSAEFAGPALATELVLGAGAGWWVSRTVPDRESISRPPTRQTAGAGGER